MQQQLPPKKPQPLSSESEASDEADARDKAWQHVDELLDEALRATFPASDALAIGRREKV